MSKAKQNKKASQLKRKQILEEVFKKGKKQREIAKKFDEKIAQKQGKGKRKEKFIQMKQKKKVEGNATRELVTELDKKLDDLRRNRKAGSSLL